MRLVGAVLAVVVAPGLIGPAALAESAPDYVIVEEMEVPAAPEEAPPSVPPVVRFDGWLDSRGAVDLGFDGAAEDVFELRNRFGLGLSWRPRAELEVAVSGRLTHRVLLEQAREPGDQRASTRRAWFTTELMGAWVAWRLPRRVELTAGRRVLRWGLTELARPLDVLCPVDLRDGPMATPALERLPVWSAEATWRLGEVAVSAVWIPLFEANAYELVGSDWAGPVSELPAPLPQLWGRLAEAVHPTRYEELGPALTATRDPPQDGLSGSQVGVRATRELGAARVGLAWAWQWDRAPVFEIDGSALDEALMGLATASDSGAPAAYREALRLEYERRHVVGAELGVRAGDVDVRADVAMFTRQTFYAREGRAGPLRSLRAPALHWALEGAWRPAPRFDLVLSLSHLLPFAGDRLSAGESLVYVDDGLWRLDLLASLRLAADNRVRVELAASAAFPAGELLVAPRVAWRVIGGWSLAVGLTLFDGRDDRLSRGAVYDRADYAYLQSTLSF